MNVGHSSTPLAKKLGIKAGGIVYPLSPPRDYRDGLAPLPDGVRFVKKPPQGGCDVVHLFAASLDDLTSGLPEARAAMKPDGALRVSWYRKSSKIATDVTEDDVRRLALQTDLVDVNICAVTDIGSGLKPMVHRQSRFHQPCNRHDDDDAAAMEWQ